MKKMQIVAALAAVKLQWAEAKVDKEVELTQDYATKVDSHS